MRKRSKIFVDYPVQGSLVRQLLLHWLIACIVIFVYLLCMQMFNGGIGKPLSAHLQDMWQHYGVLLVALATVFPVFVFDSIRLSHRFAGPMVPFGKALEQLARGERVPHLNFRKSDFWQQLSDNLNLIAKRLDLAEENSDEMPA